MDEPKHQTIKVWYRTYKELKRLAAEKPESLAALLDRLVQAERVRRMEKVPPPGLEPGHTV